MPEHYSADALWRTRSLYEDIRAWLATRNDVSLIGGWAVYEHVEPQRAMQSRDVDIVLHSEDALKDLVPRIPKWGLAWRVKGLRCFPDAHFADEDPLAFRLDVFTREANPKWKRMFGRQGLENIKTCPQKPLPELEWVISDKLSTVTRRRGDDAADKAAKDLIDTYNLVFHNRHSALPQDILARTYKPHRAAAAACVDSAIYLRPSYAEELDTLRLWLQS